MAAIGMWLWQEREAADCGVCKPSSKKYCTAKFCPSYILLPFGFTGPLSCLPRLRDVKTPLDVGAGTNFTLVRVRATASGTRKSADPGFVRACAPRICNQVFLKLPVETDWKCRSQDFAFIPTRTQQAVPIWRPNLVRTSTMVMPHDSMIGSFALAFAFACGRRTTSRRPAPGKVPRRQPKKGDMPNGGTEEDAELPGFPPVGPEDEEEKRK